MTPFKLFHQLIIVFLLNQFSHLISSTILTLKSSNAHLNLHRIIDSQFNNKEIYLSFKYKPLNQKFALVSGALELSTPETEVNELLKFILLINHDQPELIVYKFRSRSNLLFNYFQLNLNHTKVIRKEKIRPFLNRTIEIDKKDLNSTKEDKKWRLLSLLISKDQFNIIHTPFSSCLLNEDKQANCKQQNLNYKSNESVNRSIELNRLIIGKEWSESDGPNLDEESNQNEIKQLNESEEKHSNSNIHNTFISLQIETSNEEHYPGLIGCLNELELNGHELRFENSKDFNSDRNKSIEGNETEKEANVTDWWNVYQWNNILNGKIEFGTCNETSPCSNFCLHNATCMLNEDGRPICHCDLVGYAGEFCFFRKYPLKCSLSNMKIFLQFYS